MFIRGEALVDTVTISFTISGSRGDWTIQTTSPGNITKEDQTTEKTWYPLLTEMLAAAFENANRRRFPAGQVGAGR
jgi:hypothetical protein